LSHTLPEVHADVRRLLQKQIEEMAAGLDDDFPAYVRSVLRNALLSGYADLDQLSKLFAMHPRTMRRRLDASGSSYHQLLEEVRSDLAMHLLRDSELDVSEIAHMLQYCDARSFTRAFRRWSAETPARWRVQSRKHGDT
jgi:AraC-like DNA-binding protein